MRLLPDLVVGESVWRLPLSDRAALALVDALLAPTSTRRRQLLVRLVSEDAPLALWALCRAAPEGHDFRDAGGIAAWLEERLELLGQKSPSDDLADDSTRSESFAKLAADAAVVADLAEEASGSDQARLLGLLHGADEWLRWSATGTLPAQDLPARCLPTWLAGSLSELRELPKNARPPVAAVAEAIRRRRESSGPRDAAQRRWTTEMPELSERLPALIDSLGRLARLEARFAEALETEKLESLRQLAYGASHEINNPLANIATRAQALLIDEHDPDRRRRLSAINSQAFRATEMISDMMLFARPPKLVPEKTDISQLVHRVIEALRPLAMAQDTVISQPPPEASVPEDVSVEMLVDPVQLTVALRALCDNSLQAIGGGGHLSLAVRCPTREAAKNFTEGAAVQIIVSDDGPGISEEVRRHLFDPFYSGREAGRGLGFGLSKCWRIVTDHGGQVEIASSAGHGTTFTITLPVRAA